MGRWKQRDRHETGEEILKIGTTEKQKEGLQWEVNLYDYSYYDDEWIIDLDIVMVQVECKLADLQLHTVNYEAYIDKYSIITPHYIPVDKIVVVHGLLFIECT